MCKSLTRESKYFAPKTIPVKESRSQRNNLETRRTDASSVISYVLLLRYEFWEWNFYRRVCCNTRHVNYPKIFNFNQIDRVDFVSIQGFTFCTVNFCLWSYHCCIVLIDIILWTNATLNSELQFENYYQENIKDILVLYNLVLSNWKLILLEY